MIVDAFKPKLTPFEFENVKAEARFDVVPALTLMLPCVDATLADAVTVFPFSPNETLFELEKTTVPEDASVVPAEIAAGDVLCE